MSNRLYMVDVFAERPLTGNPLAVVVVDNPLSDATMQRVAAEMNFSETTFVTPQSAKNGGYDVRIFTPVREIAFAGHPVLGTGWVIRHHLSSGLPDHVRLNLSVGQLVVTFESAADDGEAVWFQAPSMTLGLKADRYPVAEALGLRLDDIAGDVPIQMVSAGTSAMIVPVVDLEALRRAKLDLAMFAGLAVAGFPPLVYVFCRQAQCSDNDLSARFFFEADGVREDPATGNGAAFLGAYLLAYRLFPDTDLSIRIEQGADVGRPSVVMLRTRHGDRIDVRVGGGVVPTVQGVLL